MTKTPDEIKKGLECCCDLMGVMCPYCPYAEDGDASETCKEEMADDALALIQKLEARAHQLDLLNVGLLVEKAQLEAERDAAVKMLKDEIGCKSCAKYTGTEEYVSTDCLDCLNDCNWEWRGVQKEE